MAPTFFFSPRPPLPPRLCRASCRTGSLALLATGQEIALEPPLHFTPKTPQPILWSFTGCGDQGACPQSPCCKGPGAFSQAASGQSDSRAPCHRALCFFSPVWEGNSLHLPSLFLSLCQKVVQPEMSTKARQEKGLLLLQQPRLKDSFLNSNPQKIVIVSCWCPSLMVVGFP